MSRPCNCGSGKDSWWEYDGQGIPLSRVCPACEPERMGVFKPEIRNHYDQADVDCRIEEEE